jgi:Tol biopolymer transport system component
VTPHEAGTFVAWVDGREAPRSVARGSTRPSWSLDGRGIWAGGSGSFAEYDADTGAPLRSMNVPTDAVPTHTLELADDRLVAIFEPTGGSHAGGVALLSEREEPVWLVEDEIEEVLALAPDGTSVITARVTPMNTEELIAVPFDGSAVQSLASSGIPVGKGLDLSDDGERVTWSTCRAAVEIVELTPTGFGRTVAADESDATSLAAVGSGPQLAVLSDRSGAAQPWIADVDGRTPARMLTLPGVDPVDVAVSGDGSRFAVSTSNMGIYVGSVEGDVGARRLTDHPGDASPSFRFGDREILFTRIGSGGKPQVMRVPVAGGEPAARFDPGSSYASASPVDDRIVYLQTDENGASSIVLWDARTGVRRVVAPALGPRHFRGPRLSPDGRRLLTTIANHEVIEIELSSGRVLRDVKTNGDTVYSPVYTSAGIFLLRVAWSGNIWVAAARPR